MAFTTLISADLLSAHLPDRAFAIVDCRYKLDDEPWGEREYAARHIPGAVYAHLGHDLSGPKTGTNGRHPLPDPHTLAHTFGRLGIASGMQVVAYDQDSGMFASRLWWLLRWLGRDRVPQPARAGARRVNGREAVSGIVERVVGRPAAADRTGPRLVNLVIG